MATLTETILENPTQPVSARYGSNSNAVKPAARSTYGSDQPSDTKLRLTTPAGEALPCRRHNGPWHNFLIPSETSHLMLEVNTDQDTDSIVAGLVLFIGGREEILPIPAQDGSQISNEANTVPLQINLPHIPHWVTALLCIRITQREQNHAEQAA